MTRGIYAKDRVTPDPSSTMHAAYAHHRPAEKADYIPVFDAPTGLRAPATPSLKATPCPRVLGRLECDGAAGQNNVEGIKPLESLAEKLARCHIGGRVLDGTYVIVKLITHESGDEGFTYSELTVN